MKWKGQPARHRRLAQAARGRSGTSVSGVPQDTFSPPPPVATASGRDRRSSGRKHLSADRLPVAIATRRDRCGPHANRNARPASLPPRLQYPRYAVRTGHWRPNLAGGTLQERRLTGDRTTPSVRMCPLGVSEDIPDVGPREPMDAAMYEASHITTRPSAFPVPPSSPTTFP